MFKLKQLHLLAHNFTQDENTGRRTHSSRTSERQFPSNARGYSTLKEGEQKNISFFLEKIETNLPAQMFCTARIQSLTIRVGHTWTQCHTTFVEAHQCSGTSKKTTRVSTTPYWWKESQDHCPAHWLVQLPWLQFFLHSNISQLSTVAHRNNNGALMHDEKIHAA